MALLAGGGGRGRLSESAKKLRTAGPSPATHMLTYADVCGRMLTYANVRSRLRSCRQPYCYIQSCGMPVLIRILLYKKLRNAGSSSATRAPTYFMCPHTAIYEAAECWPLIRNAYSHIFYVSAFCFISRVRILLYMCPHTPHTPIHVSAYASYLASAYSYTCVRILLCMCPHTTMYVCPHSTTYVSAYY
jgi:hypothetical protein